MGVRITCINKDHGNHENPHVAISHLGWVEDGTGKIGKATRLEMYDFVVKGGYAYVVSGLSQARLIGEISALGTRYVKTVPDATRRDNLLTQPECAVR